MLRSRAIITTTALVAACALPASAAAQQDLRSPDTRDAANGIGLYGETAAVSQDLRSPDTRDAANGIGETAAVSQDLRSPDAQDAAGHVGLYAQDEPRAHVYQDLRSPDARDAARDLPPAPVTTVAIAEPTSGFDWGDAGVGAVGMLALVSIAAGAMLMTGTRRRRRVEIAPS